MASRSPVDHLQEVMDFLESISLLQQLPSESVRKVAEAMEIMDFEVGQEIVRGGEASQGLYIIWKGQAEAYPPVDGMVEQAPTILFPGDYFGFPCTNTSADIHQLNVTAITKVTCLVLSRNHADLLSTKSIWSKDLNVATLMERVLHLERLKVDLYRGIHLPSVISWGPIYGGMLIGQALAAASKSVDPLLLVHHVHSQFLYVGDDRLPVVYQVERIKDGHRYATRHVIGTQEGQILFRMTASFQRPEEGFEHQLPMPDAPAPEKVISQEDVASVYVLRKKLSKNRGQEFPLDVRLCEPVNVVNPEKAEARQRVWFRTKERMPDDQALQRCAAAYGTDWVFLETALRPHPIQLGPRYKIVTLNHSIWFHRSLRADDWLLFVMESPCAATGRGLIIGHIYNQQGQLVASVAQEGELRILKKSKL